MQKSLEKMDNGVALFNKLGSWLKELFQLAITKLDPLATVNVLGLFALALFFGFFTIGESLLSVIYVFADVIGQFFGKRPIIQSVDQTPLIMYAIFLLLGLFICLFIVHKNQKSELW